MTDRELLELAAKASGIRGVWEESLVKFLTIKRDLIGDFWNPLTDDGDALRLAVKLKIPLDWSVFDWAVETIGFTEPFNGDPYSATRRAIVRAAAEVGKAMP